MKNKIFGCAFCLLLVVLLLGNCAASPQDTLSQADELMSNGHVQQAQQIYTSIAQNTKGSDYAFKALQGLAFSYIRTLQTTAAAQTISRLTSDYSAQPELPKALSYLARTSAKRRAYKQAKSIYAQLAQQFPAYADGAAVGIAKVDIMFQIESSRWAEAETAVSRLISDFAGNSALPEALLDIAGRYGSKRKYKEAGNLFQLIAQQWPDAPCASQAQLDIVRVEIKGLIRAGFDAQAAAAIDKLCSDFATHPGLPRVLARIAGRYRGWGKYNKAIEVFEKLIERYPASNEIDRARLNIARCNVLSLIKAGKYAESAAAFDKMIADFPGRWGLPWALIQIAGRYEQAQQKGLAANVYNKLITDYPGSAYALESQKRLVYTQIRAGQLAEAEQAIAALKQDFAGHQDLPNSLNDIARRMNNLGHHAQAEGLFEQVTEQSSAVFDAEEARINMARSQILRLLDVGYEDAAFSAAEKLVTDFRGNYYLPWSLCRIAHQYYDKAVGLGDKNSSDAQDYLQKAVALYEKAAENAGNANAAANAQLGLAKCHQKMGDYEKAQQAYGKVASNYGESDLAWYALFLSARVYEDMGNAGVIDEQQAFTQAKAAYELLLQKHPDCKVAASVQETVNQYGAN